MAEIRILPTNFLAWPRIRDLITQQKFICSYLWVNRFTSACGCYLLPLAAAAAELSMSENSLPDALGEFQRRGLIEQDLETGEILILDWFRWHRLNARSRGMVEGAINKIDSPRLKALTEELYSQFGGEKPKINDLPPNTTEQNTTEQNTHNDVCGIAGLTDGVCQIFHAAVTRGNVEDRPAYLKSLIPGYKGLVTDAQAQAALARGEALAGQGLERKKIQDELKRQEIFLKQGDREAASKIEFLRNRLDQSA